jgi:hypothetical protein
MIYHLFELPYIREQKARLARIAKGAEDFLRWLKRQQ